MLKRTLLRLFLPLVGSALLPVASWAQPPAPVPAPLSKPSVVFKVQAASERIEMTVHTSKILTMDQKIPQAQVNNPDILELTPLSPTQVQVSAKAAGVTQINLWGENQKLFTIDVMVYGDARELEMLLKATFPNDALKVVPVSNAIMISGFVDQQDHIDRIIRIAEEYYPKVINNMTVGGVQVVLLHTKVMEVSRTKLRRLGFDWTKVTGPNVVTSGAAGGLSTLIDTTPPDGSKIWGPIIAKGGNGTFAFGIVNGTNAFFGVLDALRQDNLMKIVSEPTLVANNGRPAKFQAGGAIPVPEPQSLGTISFAYKDYGTSMDFVPIVLGNGKLRLEVRSVVSQLDYANSVTISGTTVPGLKQRGADTAVEMMAGQTLAIAGLVESRVEAINSGLPWLSEVPYLRLAFGRVSHTTNEVELLILVTPELVEPMDADEVPPCGPGMQTTNPSDWELFMKGHLEVPKCCPAGPRDGPNGQPSDGPPPDGMIGPTEKIPTPSPSGADGWRRPVRGGGETVSERQSGNRKWAGAYNRYDSSNSIPPAADTAGESQKGPPGLIGPVGYDVVK